MPKLVTSYDSLNIFRYKMEMLGVWPKEDSSVWYRLYGWATIFSVGILSTATLTQNFYLISDAAAVSYGLCSMLATYQCFIKYVVLYTHKTEFFKLLEVMQHPQFTAHDANLNVLIQKKIKLTNLLFNGFMVSVACCVIFQTVSPAFENVERPLPIPFPLDMTKRSFIAYMAVYTVQTVVCAIVAWCTTCIDILLFTVMGMAAAQLEILRARIVKTTDICKSAAQNDQEALEQDAIVNDALRTCVIHHTAIEDFVTCIENTFTIAAFFQLIMLLGGICFLGINFVVMTGFSAAFIRTLCLLVAALMELSIYCAQGNEVTYHSGKVGEACYMTEWTDRGPTVRKTLFIIMERSKRPFVLTSGKFAPLSLETLVSVLQTGFSYFTVISNLYSK